MREGKEGKEEGKGRREGKGEGEWKGAWNERRKQERGEGVMRGTGRRMRQGRRVENGKKSGKNGEMISLLMQVERDERNREQADITDHQSQFEMIRNRRARTANHPCSSVLW